MALKWLKAQQRVPIFCPSCHIIIKNEDTTPSSHCNSCNPAIYHPTDHIELAGDDTQTLTEPPAASILAELEAEPVERMGLGISPGPTGNIGAGCSPPKFSVHTTSSSIFQQANSESVYEGISPEPAVPKPSTPELSRKISMASLSLQPKCAFGHSGIILPDCVAHKPVFVGDKVSRMSSVRQRAVENLARRFEKMAVEGQLEHAEEKSAAKVKRKKKVEIPAEEEPEEGEELTLSEMLVMRDTPADVWRKKAVARGRDPAEVVKRKWDRRMRRAAGEIQGEEEKMREAARKVVLERKHRGWVPVRRDQQ